MSKHERELKRRRKKVERGRRRRRSGRRAALALAGAAAIAAGTQAYADPIRFDNPPGPGHFVWTALPGQDLLDILADAASQPGAAGAAGTLFTFEYYGYGTVIDGTEWSTAPQVINGPVAAYVGGVDAGVNIPAASLEDFQIGFIYLIYPGYGGSFLPEGQQTYLGARFDPGDGFHYGWVGVVRTGMEVDAFAWGYETEPGVPIPAGIPEPGTLALLAFGAGAALRRKRPA